MEELKKNIDANGDLFANTAVLFCMALGLSTDEENDAAIDFFLKVWEEHIQAATGQPMALIAPFVEIPTAFASVVLVDALKRWQAMGESISNLLTKKE